MPLDAAQRSAIGKIGVSARLAREDTHAMTAAARAGQWERYYSQTDPDLPEPERVRRALALRDQHMARMRLARATAAKRRRDSSAAATEQEAWREARQERNEREQAALEQVAIVLAGLDERAGQPTV